MTARPRRLLRLLVAAILVVAACGSDDEAATTDVGSTTSTSPAVSEDPGPGQGGAETTATTAGSPGTPAPTSAQGPTDTFTVPNPTRVTPPEPGDVGDFAGYYLRAGVPDEVLISIHSQDGAAPAPSTVNHLRENLAAVSRLRVGAATSRIGGGARSWTGADIRALADSVAPPQELDRAVLTVLFLRGGFAGRDTVVGVAVRSDVMAVFADRVDDATGLVGDRDRIERAVALHELGHLLGLVDLVLDTGREDPQHPGHSPNTESVMYHAVESTLVGDLLVEGPPTEFDQADLDDLARIRDS